jgi:hypothetical protein
MAEPPVWLDEEREKAASEAPLSHSADHRLAASAVAQCVSDTRKQSTERDWSHLKNTARFTGALRPQQLTVRTDNVFIMEKMIKQPCKAFAPP